jgi:hypothetical protein
MQLPCSYPPATPQLPPSYLRVLGRARRGGTAAEPTERGRHQLLLRLCVLCLCVLRRLRLPLRLARARAARLLALLLRLPSGRPRRSTCISGLH